MQPASAATDAPQLESRRRRLVTYPRTSHASPYGTAANQPASLAASTAKATALRPHSLSQPSSLSSSARRERALTTNRPSHSSTTPAHPPQPTSPATTRTPSGSAQPTTAAQRSRVPELTMADLAAASKLTGEKAGRRAAASRSPVAVKKEESAAPTQTTVRVGALIVHRGATSPRPGQSASEGASAVSSPYAASPIGSPRQLPAAPFGPNALTVHDACDLFDLHHVLQHRLMDELGWSLHWYLDTESEIQQLELARELNEKAKATKGGAAQPSAPGAPPTSHPLDDGDATAAAVTPRHSDPNTPQSYRVDAQGRQLPFIKQKSQFGVMTTRFECSLCHELAAVRRSAFAFTPRSRLSRSPYEFRLASLRRWLRKRASESTSGALLAACLSVTVQRYLAYLGVADCWTSLFVTAGLPVLDGGAATSPANSPTAARVRPTSLSSPTRFERVPLSFYVLPALCRWKSVKTARVEVMLRGATEHPFPLARCAPDSAASSLTFFTMQRRSYLPEKRRSSSRRNQMASLGESCTCDVYLVAAMAPRERAANVATGAVVGDGAESAAAASVWGYIPPDGTGGVGDAKGLRQTGEFFYIASSVENYLRLGIVFGWVYGWQMCFSTAGPPPNSVPWLQCINSSAYAAALVANRDAAP